MRTKHFFGSHAAGVTFDSSNDGVTPSRDLNGAKQTQTGGVLIRIHTGTRNGAGVLDCDIYDSEDGVNFQKKASFTQITAAGDYQKDPGFRLRPFVRLDLILTSGTGFDDVRAWAEYEEDRDSGRPAGGIREA